MEENTNVFLGTERVGKLMRGYAVPEMPLCWILDSEQAH